MAKPYIISALDIGSGFLKMVVVSKKRGEKDFEILGFNKEPSAGVRKGVVVDVQKAAEKISLLTKKIEQECGRKIINIYANISGGHIFYTLSRGLVSVSRADQQISEEDVDRVLKAAKAISISPNKEIIEILPKEFIVDGETGVKEPVGMAGVRLEAETLLICGFSPYIKNTTQAILRAGLQINDLIVNPLASAKAVLTSREKELGVCVLDIGTATTSMAVFEEGNLIQTAIFPIGSSHITNDIAICLKTDIDTAEKIKLEFGTSDLNHFKSKKEEKKISLSYQNKKSEKEENISFSKKDLTKIIGARISEIFDLVNKELKKISKQKMLPAGIVLTGGGAKMPKIKELAKNNLKLPCRLGGPKVPSNFQEDLSLSVLYGLILEGIEIEEGEEIVSDFNKKEKNGLRKLLSFFKNLIP